MAEFDVAIVGKSLLSGLLAGVLARDHGKKVVRIGRPQSTQRLPRGLNLALPLATRPQSWRMLCRAEGETRVLLGSIGVAEAITTAPMEMIADLPETAAALDHLAHMAAGHGHQVRRLGQGWAWRHISSIDHEAVDRRLNEWLKATGAAVLDEGPVDAAVTILADDDAVFDLVAEGVRPRPLISQAMTSTLVVSPRGLQAPVRRFADRGVTLVARPGNTILAIVCGEDEVDERLASVLPGPFPMKRLATTRYRRFTTIDGAPLIGNVGKHFLIAGLGDAAPFFAPALARFVASAADDGDNQWFAAHDPARTRVPVADFVSAVEASA